MSSSLGGISLPVPMPLEPMESEAIDELPPGPGWQYEPKWDGFRCIAFKAGGSVFIQSRNGKPLGRYFPELEARLRALDVRKLVLDGELVVPVNGELSFEMLQLRLHPAASRVTQLAAEHPVHFMVFDLLVDPKGRSLLDRALAGRRATLERFFEGVPQPDMLQLTPVTRSRDQAQEWLRQLGHSLDGIVAKRLDDVYQPGRRVMRKYKLWRTVDCVVAGVYLKPGTQLVDSLLLGLYDEAGLLHYVGRSTIYGDREITAKVEPLMGSGGFTGRVPAGKNRWSGRERLVVPVRPELVVEVSADHITEQHFRHGSRILRWRTDKRPEACRMEQLGRS